MCRVVPALITMLIRWLGVAHGRRRRRVTRRREPNSSGLTLAAFALAARASSARQAREVGACGIKRGETSR